MRQLLVLVLLLWSPSLWADTTPRFWPVEVIVDPAGNSIAAYQIEVSIRGDARIVGVEGGEHSAFQAAPYYDPAALSQHRIVIAAFSTESNVPTERTRIARLHVREGASGSADYSARLIAAADPDGKRINATVSLQPHQGEGQ